MTGLSTASPPPPRAIYQQRRDQRLAEANAVQIRHGRLGTLRFITAIVAIAMAVVAFRTHQLSAGWVWAPVLVFTTLAIWQGRLGQRRRRLLTMVAFWEHGLARIDDEWSEKGNLGEPFADEDHLYARDLDLFGRGSLFQLLCQARTPEGQTRLANWLKSPAAPQTVLQRQGAVRELGPRLDLREALAVAAQERRDDLHAHALRTWANQPPVNWPRGRVLATRIVMVALGLTFAVIMPLAFMGRVSGFYLAGLLLVELAFMTTLKPFMDPVVGQSSSRLAELDSLVALLRIIESETFDAPILKDIQARLRTEGDPPSRRVRAIGRLVSMFDAGRNQLLIPIAFPLFWPHHFAISIEAWRTRHAAAVVRWLDAMADVEALVSLAAFAYEHPNYAFATLNTGAPVITGTNVGHPLLPAKQRVCNDVALGGNQQPDGDGARLLLISGSNMSGKSTYLRTVGINTVLALAGAPVCADSFALTPVRIGATLNVHDSLQEGRSRFYAEITRIRQIVALTEIPGDTDALLFLFDEILHGTNSDDRQVGAAGVLRGLLSRHTLGMVTTHDLALTRIADAVGATTRNVHFQDTMEDDGMKFDYRLRPGVVTRSNALALMRAVGLPV